MCPHFYNHVSALILPTQQSPYSAMSTTQATTYTAISYITIIMFIEYGPVLVYTEYPREMPRD